MLVTLLAVSSLNQLLHISKVQVYELNVYIDNGVFMEKVLAYFIFTAPLGCGESPGVQTN